MPARLRSVRQPIRSRLVQCPMTDKLDLASALAALADAFDESVDICTSLDSRAGDGDLGVTVAKIAQAIRSSLGDVALAPADRLKAVGVAIAKAAPSTFGTLIATGFLRASPAVAGDISGQVAVVAALRAAQDGIAARGKSELGQRTLLDALMPATDALAAAPNLGDGLRAAAAAAEGGAERTALMEPVHGRAGWIADRARGNPDAGAVAIAWAFRGVASRCAPS